MYLRHLFYPNSIPILGFGTEPVQCTNRKIVHWQEDTVQLVWLEEKEALQKYCSITNNESKILFRYSVHHVNKTILNSIFCTTQIVYQSNAGWSVWRIQPFNSASLCLSNLHFSWWIHSLCQQFILCLVFEACLMLQDTPKKHLAVQLPTSTRLNIFVEWS